MQPARQNTATKIIVFSLVGSDNPAPKKSQVSRLAMLHELLKLQGQIHDQAGTGKRQRLA